MYSILCVVLGVNGVFIIYGLRRAIKLWRGGSNIMGGGQKSVMILSEISKNMHLP